MPPVAKKKPLKKAASAKPRPAGHTVTARGRVFRNGRSDAVRIPASMRFPEREVDFIKTEDGILMRPCAKLTEKEFWARLDEARKLLPAGFEFVRPPQGEFEKREPLFD